jgi:8-oxo-dGTP pyrophosphatase MutT (NUDIX family)
MKTSKDAQAVIYKKEAGTVLFLVISRLDKEKNEVHYRLVKGGVEQGENPKETIAREIKEEVGLSHIKIGDIIHHYSYNAGDICHDIDVFLVESIGEQAPSPDSTHEGGFTIKRAEWVDKETALQLLHFEEERGCVLKACSVI